MVYLKSVENVIALGKLIGLLFLFCLPLLSILFLKTKRNDLARPVMGTISSKYVYVIARAGVIFGIYFTSCRYRGGFILPLYIFCRKDIQSWY